MTRAHRITHALGAVLLVAIAGMSLGGCVVATSSNSSGDGGVGFAFFLLPLLFVAFTAWSISRRTRRARSRRWADDRTEATPAVDRELLRAEVSVLADDVLRLEPQVALNEAARDDFEAATHRYRVAQAALETNAPLDLERVQRVVDEATWSMSRVRAILDGRTPPPPPTPLQHPGSRGEPALTVDDREQPVYVDAPVEYRSGWFAGGGGLFGGLLLGSMLGFGGGWVVDGDDDADGGDIDEW